MSKNPATKLTRDDKLEKQLTKKAINAQPAVCLALAKAAFQATGKYEVALKAFESKDPADQTIVNFPMLIIAEYSKHYKNDKTKAKSVGFGIVNTFITKEMELAKAVARDSEMALTLGEIIQNVQAVNDKKWKPSWIS